MKRFLLGVLRGRCWWSIITMVALGLGLAAMTLGADPPNRSLVKTVVFKVKGSPDPLPHDKILEAVSKIKKPAAAPKKLAKTLIKTPESNPKPLSSKEKQLIIQHANPALKNLRLRPLEYTEASFRTKLVTLTPGVPYQVVDNVTSYLGFFDVHVVQGAPGRLGIASFLANEKSHPFVGSSFWCPRAGNYLLVFHINSYHAADFMLSAYQNPSWIYETRQLESGDHAVPVLINITGPGFSSAQIYCSQANWDFYSLDIQRVE